MNTYVATLTSNKGYKEIKVLITPKVGADKKEMQRLALNKICKKRYWQKNDLVRYGYLKIGFQKKEN